MAAVSVMLLLRYVSVCRYYFTVVAGRGGANKTNKKNAATQICIIIFFYFSLNFAILIKYQIIFISLGFKQLFKWNLLLTLMFSLTFFNKPIICFFNVKS